MLRFILYALLIFLVIQIVRSTAKIRSNVHKWKEEDTDAPKPPTLNIPDIQDAKFEDLTGPESGEKDTPKEPTGNP